MINAMLRNHLRTFRAPIYALFLWIALDASCLAQSRPPLVKPAPIGSPNVPVGPLPNPFGSPPLAIGPGPLPVDRGFYSTPNPAPPFFAQEGRYPITTYEVRRPSPIEPFGSNAAPSGPAGFEDRISPKSVEPSPIGNLRLTVSENFLNRLIAREENKPGEVRDVILGAQVSGHQTTMTRLRFDLLPALDKARGMLVLNGETQSATTGVTPQASVDVASRQDFVAMKELFFDGMSISTRHAVVSVRASNQTLGAVTPLTGTLFGGIANRIAYREAERRRPAAEAVARDRVAERVYPEFDTSIDRQLASANDQLENVLRRKLIELNLMPTKQQISSSDTSLNFSAQVGSDSTPETGPPLRSGMDQENGVGLAVHESLLNALIDRAGLRGLKTTEQQLREMLAPYEIKSTDVGNDRNPPPIALPGMKNIVTEVEFDKTNPLTIRIDQDQTLMTLRAKFRPGGQDILPALAVTIPYRTELSRDKIIVTPGKVQVSLLDSADETATTTIALKLVSQGIEANLTKLGFERSLPASIWTANGVVPRINGIQSQDGWATISID